jgi:hypothetical protein
VGVGEDSFAGRHNGGRPRDRTSIVVHKHPIGFLVPSKEVL